MMKYLTKEVRIGIAGTSLSFLQIGTTSSASFNIRTASCRGSTRHLRSDVVFAVHQVFGPIHLNFAQGLP